MEYNKDQQKVVDYIKYKLDKDETLLLFIHGMAGTGKSFLIERIEELFSNNLKIIKTSYTGVSANNIGGNTLHKTFHINVKSNTDEKENYYNFVCNLESKSVVINENTIRYIYTLRIIIGTLGMTFRYKVPIHSVLELSDKIF